jgi:MFS transporter, OCT family, solute carrier family 22 (organic cation transporter), member 4/5
MPLVAILVPQWRPMMATCSVAALFLLVLAPCYTESPRWLLSQVCCCSSPGKAADHRAEHLGQKAKLTLKTFLQGRAVDGSRVLEGIAVGNRKEMPQRPLSVPTSDGPRATIWDTFRFPELRRRQIVMMFCWCVVSLAYYGVSLALEDLGGSLSLNFFFVSLIELPSYTATIAVRTPAAFLR